MAQVDYFLKIDGIVGESADKSEKGSIDLESWSWGETNSGSHGFGGGGGAGKVAMQDFHFVMKMNSASPLLFLACADGTHIKKATLTCRKAGGQQEPYLKIDFEGLLISSYQTGGSAHGEVVPTDQIAFNFTKILIDYKQQDEKGVVQNKAKRGWDVKANVKI